MTNFNGTSRSLTSTMDKDFDFTPFNSKKLIMKDKPEISELNKITDKTLNKGLLKTIVMAGNGTFERQDSLYGFSIKNQSGDYVGLGEAYEKLSDGCFITENPAPKLPREALETVMEWYKRITQKNKEEAQVNFYWNRYKKTVVKDDDEKEVELESIPGIHIWSDELFSYTPLQYNHGSLTEVADKDEWYDRFNKQFGMYVETHSHNVMDAFASGTEISTSANDGFQLVFGKLDTEHPIMYSWMTMNRVMRLGMTEEELGKIMEMNPDSHYDATTEKLVYDTNKLTFKEELFEQWDQQVIKRPVRTYSGYGAGSLYTQGTTGSQSTTPGNWDESWFFDGYSQGHSTPKTSTTISPYAYFKHVENEKELVQDAFIDALDGSIVHQILRSQEELVEYNMVIDLMKDAFYAGYLAHQNGPVRLSEATKDRLYMTVVESVDGLLEDFYEIKE